jgi:formylglycine-generating enzyme required for sulfatase activity
MPRYSIKSYRGPEPYAFVSYAHADSERVFVEMERLNTAGFRLYYDEGIHPGQSWQEELAEAIEGCSIFIIFVTAGAVVSRNCVRELDFALNRECEILAVHLDDVVLPPGLQLALGDRQAIIRSNHDQAKYESLLDTSLGALMPRSADKNDATPGQQNLPRRTSWFRAFALLVGISAIIGAGLVWNNANRHREDQLSRYSAFMDAFEADDAMSAYLAGRDLDIKVLDEPDFQELWQEVTMPVNLQIDTPGAEVWFRPYLHPDTPWIAIGHAPFSEPIDMPRGAIALRVEKPGLISGIYAVRVPGPIAVPTEDYEWPFDRIGIKLQPKGQLGDQMVAVPATNMPVWVRGWTRDVFGNNRHAIPAFAIARDEVTNAAYQVFVDSGGYQESGYWKGLEIEQNGELIPVDQTLEQFVDQTGVAGPAGWSLGRFPEGEGSVPVTGISWYEAVAFARFRGLTLPTSHHWAMYSLGPQEGEAHLGPAISSVSNYDRQSVLPVSDSRGLGPWGTNDTGGNVREWVWNRASGQHLAMGGSWSDYRTDIGNATVVDAMSRNEFTGMRLMQLLGDAQIEPELLSPIELIPVELSNRIPVSDEAFEVMRYQFSGTSRTPNQIEVTEIETSDSWILETHNLIYEDDSRFRIFVMRPRVKLPLYQAVVYAPHGGGFSPGRKVEHVRGIIGHAEKAVLTGRWVLMPEWYKSFDRFVPYEMTKDHEVMVKRARLRTKAWFQDSVDTLNYINILENIDKGKIAFISESYGSSVFGPKLLALQPRYKAAILLTAGLHDGAIEPWNDNVNYLPRITQPVLMMNGRFDPVFSHETSQLPFFNLLGTPPEHKRHVLYDDGHFRIPENLASREIARWLDQYLGPVR